jgi:hypothetical protein
LKIPATRYGYMGVNHTVGPVVTSRSGEEYPRPEAIDLATLPSS